MSSVNRKKTWIFWFVFVLAVPLLVVVNPLSQYVGNQKAYGRPVLLNINTLPLPPLVGRTVHNDRGGILSIRDGFFTFRIASLLEYPRLSYDQEGYPPSRESFWTMMYASAQSANFPNYPPSWSTRGTQGFALTRGILVLGLIPTLLVLVGFFMEAGMIGKALLRRDLALAEAANYGLFVLATAGYVCFAILYALFYQTFLVMKGIFIFPAWLAYPVLFLRASDDLSNRVTRAALWIFTIIITILLLLYAADIVAIVIRIMRY
jgi:hypothetical protein